MKIIKIWWAYFFSLFAFSLQIWKAQKYYFSQPKRTNANWKLKAGKMFFMCDANSQRKKTMNLIHKAKKTLKQSDFYKLIKRQTKCFVYITCDGPVTVVYIDWKYFCFAFSLHEYVSLFSCFSRDIHLLVFLLMCHVSSVPRKYFKKASWIQTQTWNIQKHVLKHQTDKTCTIKTLKAFETLLHWVVYSVTSGCVKL